MSRARIVLVGLVIALSTALGCSEDGGPAGEDSAPLGIRYTSPEPSATGHPLDKDVRVVFNKRLDPAQPEDAIVVEDSTGTPASGKAFPNQNALIFTPARYRQGETYTVTVSADVQSGGTSLGQSHSFSFTTGQTRRDGSEPPHEDADPMGRGKQLTLGRMPEYLLYWDEGVDDHFSVQNPPHWPEGVSPSSSYLETILDERNSWLEEEKLPVVAQMDDDGWDEIAYFTKPAGQDQLVSLVIQDTWRSEEFTTVFVDIGTLSTDYIDADAGDFDGDGRDEVALLTGTSGGSGRIRIHIIDWDPDAQTYTITDTVEFGESLSQTAGFTLEYAKIAVGDVDGDALAEAVVAWHDAVKLPANQSSAYTHYWSTSRFRVFDDLTNGLSAMTPERFVKSSMRWGGQYLYNAPSPVSFAHRYCQDPYIAVETGDIDGDGIQEVLFGLTEPVFHNWNTTAIEVKCSVRETLVFADLGHSSGPAPRIAEYPQWPDDPAPGSTLDEVYPSYHLYPEKNGNPDTRRVWIDIVDTSVVGYDGPVSPGRRYWVPSRPMSMLLAGDTDGDGRQEVVFHNRIFKFESGTRDDLPRLAADWPVAIPESMLTLTKDWHLDSYWNEPHELAEGGPVSDVGIGDIDGDIREDIVLAREWNTGDPDELSFSIDHFDWIDGYRLDDPDNPGFRLEFQFDDHSDYFQYGSKGREYFARAGRLRFALPNVDDDSMIIEKVSHDTYLGEANVVAVLAAPPCSSDLEQRLDDCTTFFETKTFSGWERGTYLDVHAGVLVGFDADQSVKILGLFEAAGAKQELEVVIGVDFGWDWRHGYRNTEALGWTLKGIEDNAVLFESYVYDRYLYKVIDYADPELIGTLASVSVPTGRSMMLTSQEYYNENNGDQMDIDEDILSVVAGDLDSYPSLSEAQDLLAQAGTHRVGLSQAIHPPMLEGAISHATLESEVWDTHEFQIGGFLDVTYKACGGAGGMKFCAGLDAGVGAGHAFDYTWGSGTVLSGTLAGVPADLVGETYEAGIFSYRKVVDTDEEKQKILVFNYYVNR